MAPAAAAANSDTAGTCARPCSGATKSAEAAEATVSDTAAAAEADATASAAPATAATGRIGSINRNSAEHQRCCCPY
ncbi:hypothetical protein [Pandoraea norimbergensis]|uniref:hypothetical protein n=1 Tax=Pandoraea norimbergensis TaxID=93219 RepID=UPI0012F493DC|nr:hypothetical protein [Pandoraea norimbergensis]